MGAKSCKNSKEEGQPVVKKSPEPKPVFDKTRQPQKGILKKREQPKMEKGNIQWDEHGI